MFRIERLMCVQSKEEPTFVIRKIDVQIKREAAFSLFSYFCNTNKTVAAFLVLLSYFYNAKNERSKQVGGCFCNRKNLCSKQAGGGGAGKGGGEGGYVCNMKRVFKTSEASF